MQQVLQHLTLDEAQVALAAAVLVMLLYRFLDLVAKRDFVIVSKQQCTQALPKSAARVARSTFFRHFEDRSEEHTSELQSLMRISYAVFCLKKKKTRQNTNYRVELKDKRYIHDTYHTTARTTST